MNNVTTTLTDTTTGIRTARGEQLRITVCIHTMMNVYDTQYTTNATSDIMQRTIFTFSNYSRF